jgi:hypothetical protein
MPATKDVVTTIVTAAVILTALALALIPVVWLVVHGYRWALS